MTSNELPLGEYIFRRLYGLGIKHIFGVPGDFNLNLIDHVDSVPGLEWIGNCNELNAAYAADGYARVRGLPGVVVTTYGVGELSAINGISGAYAEMLPVIHIVGMTPRAAQHAKLMIHHTLGEDIDHSIYREVSKPLCATSAYLVDDKTFTQEVDRVIEVACKTKLPVYLFVPIDCPDLLVDASRLEAPLDVEIRNEGKVDVEDEVVALILDVLDKAKKPSFLVDLLVRRFQLTREVREIVNATGYPAFVTPLGKSIIDETDSNFGGVYVGPVTPSSETKEAIETSDAVVYAGRFPTDSNTAGWRQKLAEEGTLVILHPNYVSIGDKRYEGISFVPVVKKLVEQVKTKSASLASKAWKVNNTVPKKPSALQGPIKQSGFWPSFIPFLQQDDCVVAEVGTAQYASLTVPLPANSDFHTQIFYSCIGYTVGGVLGMMAARRELELPGRVVLFVGDGSLQMTVQEISTMIHNGFKPLIIVLNNAGYTIERVIHGPARKYNGIAPWNYQKLLSFFGAEEDNSATYRAATYEELQGLLANPKVAACDRIQLLECILDKYDAPEILSTMVDTNQAVQAKMLAAQDEAAGRRRVKLDGSLTQSGLSCGVNGKD